MIRDYFSQLPPDKLKRIADKLGVIFPDKSSITEEDFYQSLEDSVEEYIQERQIISSDLSQSAPKKFYMYSQDQQIIDLLESHSYESSSNGTKLVSVLKDPSWVYVYWDISLSHLTSLHYDPQKDKLGLRIIYDQALFDEGAAYFDILLSEMKGDRYISLPISNATYWVELFLRKGVNRRITLGRSVEFYAPQMESLFLNQKMENPVWKILQDSLSELDSESSNIESTAISLLNFKNFQ